MKTNKREMKNRKADSISVNSRPFGDRGGTTNEHE